MGDTIGPASIGANGAAAAAAARSPQDVIGRAYPMLRQMALAKARANSAAAMSPSSLVQETVCRLLRQPQPPASENHVQAAAWKVMDWVLTDRFRAETARDRREGQHQPHGSGYNGDTYGQALADAGGDAGGDAMVAALRSLAERSPRKAEAFTLHALCGLGMERIAELLEVNVKTVQRDIAFARAWVAAELAGGARGATGGTGAGRSGPGG